MLMACLEFYFFNNNNAFIFVSLYLKNMTEGVKLCSVGVL